MTRGLFNMARDLMNKRIREEPQAPAIVPANQLLRPIEQSPTQDEYLQLQFSTFESIMFEEINKLNIKIDLLRVDILKCFNKAGIYLTDA